MKEQPKSKLTKAQYTILGNLIAYCVLNGINPKSQRTMIDGRIASGLIKKGYLCLDGIEDLNKQRVYTITNAGIDAYWNQKNAKK